MYHFNIKLGLTSKDKSTKWDYTTAERVVGARLKLGGFNGASFSYARGYWMGDFEDTLVIDIYDSYEKLDIVKDMCAGLRIDFAQDCVLLQHAPAADTLFI